MGSMLGAYLQAGGADVTLLVRREALAQKLRDPGLQIRFYTQEGMQAADPVPMKASTACDGLPVMDALIVMVKGPDTADALEGAKALIGPETRVVTLQNGLGAADILARQVPAEHVYYGCLNMSAIMEAPAVIAGGLFGDVNVHFGPLVRDPAQQPFGEALAELFRAGGLTARYHENVDAEVWTKLLMNVAVNAGCGLVRLRGGEAGSDQNFVLVSVDMIKEAIAVAAKLGVPLDFNHFMTHVLPVARKTSGKHYPSMAQDMMMSKSRTEIDFINGAIERLGAQVGVPTPVNSTIARLVRTIENNYDKQYQPKPAAASGPSYTVTITENYCKGCGFCVKYCPKQVLAIDAASGKKGYHTAKVTAPQNCVGCMSCALVCPEGAIGITKEGA